MTGQDIDYALRLLEAGKLVAIPTETVYGLAGNALDPKAVSRIFEVKNRPHFDPLIVHTGELERLAGLVKEIPEPARKLARAFMPGPLTLLLPKTTRIPDLVTAGSEQVAVRIPDHPLTLHLLRKLAFPLAAPSANPFGYISPTRAEHVVDQLGDQIAYILDGGPCSIGLESTIVGFPNGVPTIYRKGGTPIEEIELIIGQVSVRPHSSSNPQAPGMLKSHYAPRIPLQIGAPATLIHGHSPDQIGLLAFRRLYAAIPADHQFVLSETGDLRVAAQRLFAGLRYLDQLDIELIIAEPVPEEGLGRAINDRLRRAAVR